MIKKRRYKRVYPDANCTICGRQLQGKSTIELGVCSRCFATLPQFKEARNKRQLEYLKNNPEQYEMLKKKRRERYYQKGV